MERRTAWRQRQHDDLHEHLYSNYLGYTGSYTETAVFSGDGNYTGSSSPQTNNFTINQATATGALTSSRIRRLRGNR